MRHSDRKSLHRWRSLCRMQSKTCVQQLHAPLLAPSAHVPATRKRMSVPRAAARAQRARSLRELALQLSQACPPSKSRCRPGLQSRAVPSSETLQAEPARGPDVGSGQGTKHRLQCSRSDGGAHGELSSRKAKPQGSLGKRKGPSRWQRSFLGQYAGHCKGFGALTRARATGASHRNHPD